MTGKQTSYNGVLIKLHFTDSGFGCSAYTLHTTLSRSEEIAKTQFGMKNVKQRSVRRACDRSSAGICIRQSAETSGMQARKSPVVAVQAK